MTRFVALLGEPLPLGGACPACDQIMDESGCRIGERALVDDPARGIAQVVEVFCHGTPTLPRVPCPSCEAA